MFYARATSPRLRCLGLVFACCLILSGCALSELWGGVATDYALSGDGGDESTTSYLAEILDERMAEKTKILASSKKDPELRARQEEYIEQTVRADLLKALHARGYYAAAVTFKNGDAPLSGTYDIGYGPRFTIAGFAVTPPKHAAALPQPAPKKGDPLNAATILHAQEMLRANLGRDHCYFDLAVDNSVRLNRLRHTGTVELAAKTGREGHFGSLVIEGNGSVRENHLRRLQPWQEGECFRREKLEDYKTLLLQSGLFSQADIVLPEKGPDADGAVPVKLSLKERAHRTISAGLTYYSDEGPGAVLGWEHRNLLGAAERLETSLNISSLKQSLDADFTKPYFLRKDQSLSLNTALRRQDTDAFEEFAIDLGGAVTRKFDKNLSFTTGVDASLLRINDHTLNTHSNYGLLSLPQTLTYDTRDNALDPRKGVNATLNAEPFIDLLGEADPFFKAQATVSAYAAPGKQEWLTLAAKGSLGSIWGADFASVPATERFYAGGGGSVRGYGYQEVGPQRNGDPTGGLSLATASAEARLKFSGRMGGVVFVDAGSVTTESSPDFSDMAVGVGAGVRYYTSFGPIRFDVATPLTQKNDADQSYQFYISIGQAF